MEIELTFYTFLIVCPMVFLSGFVDAIGGGGGLISVPAYLIAGIPPHITLGTNKLSSCIGTTFSTARFCKHGDVDYKLAIPGVIASLVGSAIGSEIALRISGDVFSKIMIFLLPVIAIYVFFKKDLEPKGSDTISRKTQYIVVGASSFLIGGYDGFYGPGAGTFMLLAFTALAKLPVLKAAGTVKLANLASNAAALSVFLINGKVLFPLGLVASVFSMAGHYTGSGLAIKNGSKLVRVIILCVISVLFIKILLER